MAELYKIWWEQIPNAKAVIDNIVTSAAEDRKSIIIKSSKGIPWYNEMRYIVEETVVDISSDTTLEPFADGNEEPGKLLLDTFCTQSKKNSYRNSKGYAVFLAESDDIVLNNKILWLENLEQDRVADWIKFISDYNKALKGKVGGNFILEITELPDNCNLKGIELLDIDKGISEYDYSLFNMLVASVVKLPAEIKLYLSELVKNICGSDLELSTWCMKEEYCQNFLANPYQTLLDIAAAYQDEYGDVLTISVGERDCEQAVWSAQIRRIFPVLEDFRRQFIDKYYNELTKVTLYNAQQQYIEDPRDIELGTLSYAVGNGLLKISTPEYHKLELFKEARNSLAHIRILPFETVKMVLEA